MIVDAMSSVKMTVDETTIEEITATYKMIVDAMSSVKLSVDEMSPVKITTMDTMIADEMPWVKMTLDETTIDKMMCCSFLKCDCSINLTSVNEP